MVYVARSVDLFKDSQTHFHRQKSSFVMIWVPTVPDGNKSPLVIIQETVKVNSAMYVCMKMMENDVLPWVRKSIRRPVLLCPRGCPSLHYNCFPKVVQWPIRRFLRQVHVASFEPRSESDRLLHIVFHLKRYLKGVVQPSTGFKVRFY